MLVSAKDILAYTAVGCRAVLHPTLHVNPFILIGENCTN